MNHATRRTILARSLGLTAAALPILPLELPQLPEPAPAPEYRKVFKGWRAYDRHKLTARVDRNDIEVRDINEGYSV